MSRLRTSFNAIDTAMAAGRHRRSIRSSLCLPEIQMSLCTSNFTATKVCGSAAESLATPNVVARVSPKCASQPISEADEQALAIGNLLPEPPGVDGADAQARV